MIGSVLDWLDLVTLAGSQVKRRKRLLPGRRGVGVVGYRRRRCLLRAGLKPDRYRRTGAGDVYELRYLVSVDESTARPYRQAG